MHMLRALALALVLILALAACAETGGSQDPNAPGAVTQPTADADEAAREGEAGTNPDVSDIDDDAENYYGQTVTVSGPVIEIYNDQMFRIDDPELFGGDDVLVLAPAGAAVTDAATVTVSGVVQQYDQTELEQTLGIDIDDALNTQLEGQPVIVADQVEVAAGSQ
jgi:uncharacterized protein YdeI (BOF family)